RTPAAGPRPPAAPRPKAEARSAVSWPRPVDVRRPRLEEMRAAVDHNRLAGDELAGIAGEIEDGAGEILALEVALQRLVVADRLHALLVLGAEEFLGALGEHRGGRDGVDADPIAPQLARQGARHADH